jgi:PAS domain S-box-containing protein
MKKAHEGSGARADTPTSTAAGPEGAAAAQAEEQARLLVDAIRDCSIVMLDQQGRVATWNAGAERIHGYEAEEIVGKHFSVFHRPERVKAGERERELERAEAQGRFEEEGWRVRKDGSELWAQVVLYPVRDRDGRLVGFAQVTRDISERKLAEETARQTDERFRLLVESVRDYAIFMVDPGGRVMSWNAGAQRMKQYRADEIIGQHFSRFYPEEEVRAGKCELELAEAERYGLFEDEGWRVRKDGSQFWANVTITALRSPKGELVGYAKVTRDLTERRKLEDERLRLARAEEAIRLRDEFLSIASHELKTPLTALQLQLESVRDRVDLLDHKAAGRIDRAARSGERLRDLIEALLDVSRIATGRFELSRQRFDLAEVVRDVVERLRDSADKARCELSLHAGVTVVGTWDRLRVEQLLTNLVSNAIKYAAGAPIDVSLASEGESAVLEVRDRGPGISDRDLVRIFERFERAASMRNYGGLGLGLYISREIAAAHGGVVSARNEPDGGARFTVRLPLAPRPSSEPAPAASAGRP